MASHRRPAIASRPWTRRRVLGTAALAGAGLAVRALPAGAAGLAAAMRLEGRMTPFPATWYRAYVSKPAIAADSVRWVQVDLSTVRAFDAIRLYPNFNGSDLKSLGFPAHLQVQVAEEPTFAHATLLFDGTTTDPGDHLSLLTFGRDVRARYVRVIGVELRPIQMEKSPGNSARFGLSFAKVEVLSGSRDLAVGCAVSADPESGHPHDLPQLTRQLRPVGEGVITDNPQNVTAAATWKRVPDRAHTPRSGVRLRGGVLHDAMQHNIDYLLTSFSADEMLRPFRERAGLPVPPGLRPPITFWDTDLPGSSAGRFLMGAANTLRWQEHEELRSRMNTLVDGIAACRKPNGYIMAYPEDSILHSERAGYTRAWVTHGLLEAGYTGRTDAFPLLRGYYDWFDQCQHLPELLRGTAQGVQGMVANTRVYLSDVGKPADIQVVQRYFQESYWLDGLARRDPTMIWQYPYDRPHNYLLTDMEAYLDLYRATGEQHYLNAVIGAWELYRDNWEHVGGSIAITEFGEFPPRSYRLVPQFDFCETGELCGSSFWVFLNQRLNRLYPDDERYVAEIEKSIYNIGIANQYLGKGYFYHARLVGKKGDRSVGYCTNSCCEGQGTRLMGSIPEHLFALTGESVSVHMFAPAELRWQPAGAAEPVTLVMDTSFPESADVTLRVDTAQPHPWTLRIRVPSWAEAQMPVLVNGTRVATGTPGSFVPIHRTWSAGDTVAFRLPIGFRLTRYAGMDQIAGHSRYALEYGPILMAVVGSDDVQLRSDGETETTFRNQLRAEVGSPLHFNVAGNRGQRYVPYYSVKDETFTCFPVIDRA